MAINVVTQLVAEAHQVGVEIPLTGEDGRYDAFYQPSEQELLHLDQQLPYQWLIRGEMVNRVDLYILIDIFQIRGGIEPLPRWGMMLMLCFWGSLWWYFTLFVI